MNWQDQTAEGLVQQGEIKNKRVSHKSLLHDFEDTLLFSLYEKIVYYSVKVKSVIYSCDFGNLYRKSA